MAVNSITFGGVNSADFGIYISGEGVFNAPKRDVEMIKIPGRNGEFALDNGRFENIEVTYPAFNFEPDDYDAFMQNLSDFRNAICAQRGYQRLTDSFHPDEYRMAVYKDGLDIKPVKYNTASQFDIVFDCKPQRWLKDGETAVTIGEWGETETVSGDIVEVENPNGILAVKSLEVDLEPIQDLNGYSKPWVGGAGKNLLNYDVWKTSAVLNGSAVWENNGVALTATANDCYTQQTSYPAGARVAVSEGETVTLSWSSDATTTNNGSVYIFPNGSTTGLVSANTTTGTLSYTVGSGITYITFRVGVAKSGNTIHYRNIMIRKSGDATYEPYSNICPISGHDSVDTYVSGNNLITSENTEDGAINASGVESVNANFTRTKLIPVADTIAVNFAVATGYVIRLHGYDSSGTWVRQIKDYSNVEADHDVVTIPSGISYVKLSFPKVATDVSIENVTTYTTALGRTVYGGTLDVVSGVLTVDTQTVVCNGTESWATNSGNGLTCYGKLPLATTAYQGKCNILPVLNNNRTETGVCIGYNNRHIYVNNILNVISGVTDAESWKAYLANNNLVITAPITPQTYQLTAQQISLLTGDNNIWSDGAVTLEYGQNPSVLFNPTLFESSPLLETAGSGTIQFNGYEIGFEGVPIGEVVVCPDAYTSSSSNPATLSVPLDTSLLNAGDLIYPATKGFRISAQFAVSNVRYKFTSASVTSTTNVLDASANINAKKTGLYCYLWPDFGNGFAYGIAENITCSATCNYAIDSGAVCTEQIQVTIAYDGADTITVTVSRTGTVDSKAQRSFNGINQAVIYGDSSMPNDDPIFIDCDLGEAYTNEGGVYRSLNQYIDLGSELPTLGVGANEVTFDSTITELKITPRFWKV